MQLDSIVFDSDFRIAVRHECHMGVQLPNKAIAQTAEVICFGVRVLLYDDVHDGVGLVQRSLINAVFLVADETFCTALRYIHIADVSEPEEVALLEDFQVQMHGRVFNYKIRWYHFITLLFDGSMTVL